MKKYSKLILIVGMLVVTFGLIFLKKNNNEIITTKLSKSNIENQEELDAGVWINENVGNGLVTGEIIIGGSSSKYNHDGSNKNGYCLNQGKRLIGLTDTLNNNGSAYNNNHSSSSSNTKKLNWLMDTIIRFDKLTSNYPDDVKSAGVSATELKFYKDNMKQICEEHSNATAKALVDSLSDAEIFQVQQYVIWQFTSNTSGTPTIPSSDKRYPLYKVLVDEANKHGSYAGTGNQTDDNISISKASGYGVKLGDDKQTLTVGPIYINKNGRLAKGYRISGVDKDSIKVTNNTVTSATIRRNYDNKTIANNSIARYQGWVWIDIKLGSKVTAGKKYSISGNLNLEYYQTNAICWTATGLQQVMTFSRSPKTPSLAISLAYEEPQEPVLGNYSIYLTKKTDDAPDNILSANDSLACQFKINNTTRTLEAGNFYTIVNNKEINANNVNTTQEYIIEEINPPSGYVKNDNKIKIQIIRGTNDSKTKYQVKSINIYGEMNNEWTHLGSIDAGKTSYNFGNLNLDFKVTSTKIYITYRNTKMTGKYKLSFMKKSTESTTQVTNTSDAIAGARFYIKETLWDYDCVFDGSAYDKKRLNYRDIVTTNTKETIEREITTDSEGANTDHSDIYEIREISTGIPDGYKMNEILRNGNYIKIRIIAEVNLAGDAYVAKSADISLCDKDGNEIKKPVNVKNAGGSGSSYTFKDDNGVKYCSVNFLNDELTVVVHNPEENPFKFKLQKKGTGSNDFLQNTDMTIKRTIICDNDVETHNNIIDQIIHDETFDNEEALFEYTEELVSTNHIYYYDIYENEAENGYINILGENKYIRVKVTMNEKGELSADYSINGIGDYKPTSEEITNIKKYITGVSVIPELRTVSLIITNPEKQAAYTIKAKKIDDKNQPKSGVTFSINEVLQNKNETVSRGPTNSEGIVTIESDVPITKDNYGFTDTYTINEVDVGTNALLKLNESVTINVKKHINPTTKEYEVESATFDDGTTSKSVTLQDGSTATATVEVINSVITVTIPNKEETGLTIKKRWVDNNNSDLKRPETVIVQLYANGVPVPQEEIELNESNNWSKTWSNLPKYDDNNNAIKYTVDEVGFIKASIRHDLDENGKDTTGTDANGYIWEYKKSISEENGIIIISNRLQGKYTLRIKKIDDAGKPIKGVNFSVGGVTFTTDSEGIAVIGEYGIADPGWMSVWTVAEIALPENAKYIKLKNAEDIKIYIGGVYDGENVLTDINAIFSENAEADGKEKYVELEDGTMVKATVEENNGIITITIPNKAKTEYTVRKEWQDDNNRDSLRPSSIVVQLYADGVAIEGKQVTLTSGEDGIWQDDELSWTWENLDKYSNGKEIKYSADETTVIEDYTKELVYSENETKVINKHNPERTQISVIKNWNDYDNIRGNRPTQIYVQLFKNDQACADTEEPTAFQTLNKNNNWTYTWNNLYKYENGTKINWSVKEVTADKIPLEDGERIVSGDLNGYTPIYDTTSNPGTTIITNKDNSIPLKLFKHELNNKNAAVTGAHFFIRERYNDNAENDEGKQPSEIYNDNCCELNQSIDTNGTAQEFARITDFSVGVHYYEIEEQTVPTNYIKALESIIVKVEVTTDGETTASITKVKERNSNTWVTYDESKHGNYGKVEQLNGEKSIVVYMANSVSYEFSLFKKFKADYNDGAEIKDAEKFIGTAEFKIEKYTSEGRLQTIYHGALQDAKAGFTEEEATANGRFSYRITETGVSDGYSKALLYQPIIVTIVTDKNGNVTQDSSWKYEYSWSENNADLKKLIQLEIGSNNQINLYIANTPKTTLKLFKHELGDKTKPVAGAGFLVRRCDENGEASIAYGPLPTTSDELIECFSLENIKKGDVDYFEIYEFTTPENCIRDIEKVVVKIEVTQEGKAVYTPHLVKMSTDTQYVPYSQTTHGDYVSIREVDESNTAVIYIANRPKTERTVKKVWSDNDNKDGIRPTEIQVALYVGANIYTTADSPKTLTAGEDGIWQESELTYTWTNLPKYVDGTEIPYEVREVNEPTGYIATSEVNGTTTTITNTHNPEKTGCSVEKVWNDNNNQDGIRPESIQVQLNKNGSKYEAEGVTNPVTLNESNGWRYTWNNLPKKENGENITYTIAEIGNIAGYTTAYDTTSQTNKTIITNTHTPETTERTVKKVWSDNNNQDGIRPTEIQVALYVGSNIYTTADSPKTLTAGEDGIWQESELTYTWTNLPKYASGEEIPYEVREVNEPTGYLATSEVNGTTTTITNKYTPDETEKSVEKVWNDNNDIDKIRPESIQVQLNADGKKYEAEGVQNPVTLNKENKWKHTWNKLPVKINGKDVTYEIAEIGNVDGYTSASTVSGNKTTITNTHIPESDLALRKFITKVNDKEITDRIPNVDITPLVDGTSTTATYNHTKEPVLVAQNQLVTYTIRVYNEGQTDAYASLIKDDIPDGLEFVAYTEGDGSTNDTYKWKLVDENDNEVTDVTKAKYVVSDYLSSENEKTKGENLLKAFNKETMTELDYRDVQIQFKVIEPNTSDRIVINQAQIADDSDSNGNSITDRDSTPNEWKGEDDEDIEKIRVLYFDLALRKWVTQAIVTENGQTQVTETGHKAEDDPEEVVKVDLKKSKLSNVIVKFRYSIRITNEGEIAGEAQEISDYIPQGLVFIPEDNPDWRQEEGKVVTEKLKGKTLQPGESAEVEILLTWVNSENNMGVMVNTAEISKDYNEYGSPDIDSTPNNKVPGEDDIDDAPVMLTIKTGSEIIMIVTLGLGVIAIIGAGIEIIRKKVIRN